jgi:hypothetical protein
MVNRNTLGLPEKCNDCTPPSCREILSLLADSIKIAEIGGEVHAYPPMDQNFQSRCTAAISKLAICREKSRQHTFNPENPELAL